MTALNCIAEIGKLGFPFKVPDPFLFTVYHKDLYPSSATKLPKGNGADFDWSKSFRMYHGEDLPGFPQHPHRGFETVTATIQGFVDHTDSLGNAGRFGQGDLQWMTAGRGIVHGEMFPQIYADKPNPTKFFQIWMNLPKKDKMVAPCYVMHWLEKIPKFNSDDGLTTVTLWAGQESGMSGLPPPPNSWASNENNEVSIRFIEISPGGRYTIPPAKNGRAINRSIFWTEGKALSVGDKSLAEHCSVSLFADTAAVLHNTHSSEKAEILMLQGRPIAEPVAQHGPFVMNTQDEIRDAFNDYRATGFGGWPWPQDAMSFPASKGRFSLQGGKEELPS